jgi:large subunit ribosomal protein L10
MAITKAKKGEILKSLNDIFAKAKTTVFLTYKGIPVNDQIQIRKKLLSEGVNLKVTKKTLLKKVLADKGIKGTMPEIKDEIAFATSEDLLASARESLPWTKTYKTLSIVGGIFDGEYKDAKAMMEIATIPSREVLLSKIAFLLKSPMQRIAIAVNEVAKKKTS